MDQSGDEILFVGDWVCRNGAVTFYLPAITDLGVNHPYGYVGAAEIASLQQVDYPGEHHPYGEPIFALVDIKKRKMVDPITGLVRPTNPGENQGGAYNAHPRFEKENAWGWAMPFIAMQGNGVTSRIALRNNANCNKFYGKIWITDETGTDVGVIHTPWLHPKHLKIIDLAYQGFLYPGFVGAARFEVLGVEQLCDQEPLDGIVDNKPIMPSIVVMNYGWEAELGIAPPATTLGDLTRIYEAIPYWWYYPPCYGEVHGLLIDECTSLPLGFADVYLDGELLGTTDSTGHYKIYWVEEGFHLVEAAKEGYAGASVEVFVPCGDIGMGNMELVPDASPVEVCGLVVDCDAEFLQEPIDGAKVMLGELEAETTSAGSYCIETELEPGSYDVTASMDGFYSCTQPIEVPECGDDFLRDFELDCIAPLCVHVKDDCTDIDLQETTVSIEFDLCCPEDDTKMDNQGLTDSNGNVTLDASKGTVRYVVEKEGYNTVEGEIDIDDCAGAGLEISMWPKAWVKGQTFQEPQVLLPGVDVKLVNLETGDHWYDTSMDPDAWYNHYNVEPGWYVLRFYVEGVAKCETDPFEIFVDPDWGAIDRVEATVVLDTCDFTVYGYNCGTRVRWTGRVDECEDDGLKDATGTIWTATDEANPLADTGFNLQTTASGRVKFEDPAFAAPLDGNWYVIRFTKAGTHTGVGPLDSVDTEKRENSNGSTMWFGWPGDPCLWRIP
jgi:hypothetical protein